jgi:hypothetical protein
LDVGECETHWWHDSCAQTTSTSTKSAAAASTASSRHCFLDSQRWNKQTEEKRPNLSLHSNYVETPQFVCSVVPPLFSSSTTQHPHKLNRLSSPSPFLLPPNSPLLYQSVIMDKSLDEVGPDSMLAPLLVVHISTPFDNRSSPPSPEAFAAAAPGAVTLLGPKF